MVKAQRAYAQYCNATASNLSDVYGRWSRAKQEAYDRCISVMKDRNGHDPRIVSYNIRVFTFGFVYEDDLGRWFGYITPTRYSFLKIG